MAGQTRRADGQLADEWLENKVDDVNMATCDRYVARPTDKEKSQRSPTVHETIHHDDGGQSRHRSAFSRLKQQPID